MNKTKEEIIIREQISNAIDNGRTAFKNWKSFNPSVEGMYSEDKFIIDKLESCLTDQIKSMEGQVKELRESNDKWISAIDSRPNTDINCLVYFYNSDIKEGWIETAYFTDDYFYGTVGDNKYITHWRTLPTLPTEDNT